MKWTLDKADLEFSGPWLNLTLDEVDLEVTLDEVILTISLLVFNTICDLSAQNLFHVTILIFNMEFNNRFIKQSCCVMPF